MRQSLASLARPESEPTADRAPEAIAAGVAQPLRGELEALLGPGRLRGGASDIISYASDASPYRVFPQAVVMARCSDDIKKLMAFGRSSGIPLTFRAGGTSLSGQGQGGGILIDVRRHFGGVSVEGDGARARIKPGTVLGHANRVLAPYGRKLGPDPASTEIATLGGVIANNSGGMRCGVDHDSYSTLRSMTFITASGLTLDTGAAGAAERFAQAEPELADGLAAIRDQIRADPALSERISRKFEIKNTTGYRLCAFLDAAAPLEIFQRLIVGSEGTLAFVAEAVLETVPLPARTSTAWVHFSSIDAAIGPVRELVGAGASAVELMVAPALITASYNMVGAPAQWKELPPDSAVLLVEFGAGDQDQLDDRLAEARRILSSHETIRPIEFSADPQEIELSWRVREGLHGLIGRLRPPGTALIVEDVCVPPQRIAEGASDLQALLAEHGFLPGVAGHASAGNLHFMLTPDFSKSSELDRYQAFMADLVELIVGKYDGSLKAEHGTGLNMAPYVEREWGATATEMMWQIKRLADPDAVLSPGVVLNRDPEVHLRNLKTSPPIEESVSACVECGFCEPVCPSRNLTTTPRQRIVLRREMARQGGGSALARVLLEEFNYQALETCATDGSCQLACPVGIDTGEFVRELRGARHTERAEAAALFASRRWRGIEAAARAGLRLGAPLARRSRRGRALPGPAPGQLPSTSPSAAAAIYLPSCTNRVLGRAAASSPARSLAAALVEVSRRAGLPVWIPAEVPGSCCGLPWSSKGFRRAHAHKANEMVENLWRWSAEGALPVISDAASCTQAIAEPGEGVLSEENSERLGAIEVLDSLTWVHDRLLPGLPIPQKLATATLHPSCATRRMGLRVQFESIAASLAEDVVIAPTATCCGFAGDRGIAHPELTESATREQAAELSGGRFDAHLCNNRTCELGLQRATAEPYESFVFALEQLTRAR